MRNAECEIGTFDAREPWLDRLEELVDISRIGRSGIRVALDVMYGAGQGLLSERLRRAGATVRELHGELNPGFGGLRPEPIPAHMGALMDCVKGWEGAGPRVGFAFDGDSDRVSPVDEDGNVLSPHQTLALLLRHLVLNRGQRGTVVKSVNIGHMVDAEAEALGLPLVVTPVGFKHIAEAMRQHDATVGGEESGGFAVRGHIPERDGVLISLLLLECMTMTGKPLGALVREMEAEHGPHRYGRLDLRLASLPARDRVVASVAASPPDRILSVPVRHVETMDGVKLTRADHSWIMLRASGTEPLLRIYAEAPTEERGAMRLLAWGQRRRRRGRSEGGHVEGEASAWAAAGTPVGRRPEERGATPSNEEQALGKLPARWRRGRGTRSSVWWFSRGNGSASRSTGTAPSTGWWSPGRRRSSTGKPPPDPGQEAVHGDPAAGLASDREPWAAAGGDHRGAARDVSRRGRHHPQAG